MHDPISGPVSREKLRELASLPHGQAEREIQKLDPLWGREPGEKLTWRVEAQAKCRGVAFIEAATQQEADKLADDLSDASFDWQPSGCQEIISVELDT